MGVCFKCGMDIDPNPFNHCDECIDNGEHIKGRPGGMIASDSPAKESFEAWDNPYGYHTVEGDRIIQKVAENLNRLCEEEKPKEFNRSKKVIDD